MEMLFNLIAIVTAIVTVSSIVAAITPTPKDDVWIGKLYKLVDLLAINELTVTIAVTIATTVFCKGACTSCNLENFIDSTWA